MTTVQQLAGHLISRSEYASFTYNDQRLQVYYTDSGALDTNAPVVAMLHGSGPGSAGSSSFTVNRSSLLDAGFRVRRANHNAARERTTAPAPITPNSAPGLAGGAGMRGRDSAPHFIVVVSANGSSAGWRSFVRRGDVPRAWLTSWLRDGIIEGRCRRGRPWRGVRIGCLTRRCYGWEAGLLLLRCQAG